jgi:surface-anchored protein
MKRRLLVAAAAVTAAILGFTATPAHAATITSGHIDALDVDYSGGVVTLDIKTYNPPNANDDDVPAASTTIRLQPLSDYDLTVPASPSSWACVGTAGSTVYVAPASVGSGDPRVWPGWNAEDVPATNRPVTIQLVSVSGPGHVTLYTLGGLPAQPSVVLSNNSTTGCPKSTFSISSTAPHGHANWAFSAAGNYDLTFRATVTGGTSSGNVTYHFQIG